MILHSPIFRRFHIIILLALSSFLSEVTPGTLPAQWMPISTKNLHNHCTAGQTVNKSLTNVLLHAFHTFGAKESPHPTPTLTAQNNKMSNFNNFSSPNPAMGLWPSAPLRMGFNAENLEKKAHTAEKLRIKLGSKSESPCTCIEVQNPIKCPCNFSQTFKIAQTPWIELGNSSLNAQLNFQSNFYPKSAIFGPARDFTSDTPRNLVNPTHSLHIRVDKSLPLQAINHLLIPQVVPKSSALGTNKSSPKMWFFKPSNQSGSGNILLAAINYFGKPIYGSGEPWQRLAVREPSAVPLLEKGTGPKDPHEQFINCSFHQDGHGMTMYIIGSLDSPMPQSYPPLRSITPVQFSCNLNKISFPITSQNGSTMDTFTHPYACIHDALPNLTNFHSKFDQNVNSTLVAQFPEPAALILDPPCVGNPPLGSKLPIAQVTFAPRSYRLILEIYPPPTQAKLTLFLWKKR